LKTLPTEGEAALILIDRAYHTAMELSTLAILVAPNTLLMAQAITGEREYQADYKRTRRSLIKINEFLDEH